MTDVIITSVQVIDSEYFLTHVIPMLYFTEKPVA